MGVEGFFIALIIVMVVSLILLYLSLALYTYHDAKTHTDNPKVWLLIALFVPSLFGFLIYFIAGRTKKAPSDHRYRLLAIISAVVLTLSSFAIAGSLIFSNDLPFISNVSIGMVTDNIGSHWNISYKTSGETLTRTLSLSREEMDNFTVEAGCESGDSYMLIIQNEKVIHLDITSFPEQLVNLSELDEEPFTVSLYNDKARGAFIKINWAA